MKSRLITLIAILVITGTQFLVAQTSQKREVSAFTEISLRIGADVHLKQGEQQSVEVKCSESTLAKLITEVSDRKLVIRYPNDSWFSKWNPGKVDIYITMPQIDALVILAVDDWSQAKTRAKPVVWRQFYSLRTSISPPTPSLRKPEGLDLDRS